MRLTKLEQETIILFNEAEQTAEVYTHNSRLTRRLRELHLERLEEVKLARVDGNSVTYIVPKVWIRINAPRTSTPLTAEQRKQRIAALKKARNSKIATSPCENEGEEAVN